MFLRSISGLALVALSLSGCAAINATVADSDGLERSSNEAVDAVVTFDIQSIDVDVPTTLTVSEANTYFPYADIVWREDPIGNRYEQVDAIVTAAAEKAAAEHTSGVPVAVDIEVTRFHAQTEKTRYSRISSTHDVHLLVDLLNPATGQSVIAQPVRVEAEIKAFNGQDAVDAMLRGETQKVRITQFVAAELSALLNEAVDQPTR